MPNIKSAPVFPPPLDLQRGKGLAEPHATRLDSFTNQGLGLVHKLAPQLRGDFPGSFKNADEEGKREQSVITSFSAEFLSAVRGHAEHLARVGSEGMKALRLDQPITPQDVKLENGSAELTTVMGFAPVFVDVLSRMPDDRLAVTIKSAFEPRGDRALLMLVEHGPRALVEALAARALPPIDLQERRTTFRRWNDPAAFERVQAIKDAAARLNGDARILVREFEKVSGTEQRVVRDQLTSALEPIAALLQP